MDETGVLGLLEELSILLEDSKQVFGKSNLRQVDVAAAFEIMDEIRETFPSEFSQARQIVRERQSLMDDAEAEANRMIEDARSQALPNNRPRPFWLTPASWSVRPVLVPRTMPMRCSAMWSKRWTRCWVMPAAAAIV